MKLAFYIAKEGTIVDKGIDIGSGWYGYSHTEIVFDYMRQTKPGTMFCCSCSPREDKVRFKTIDINPRQWVFVNFPAVTRSQEEVIYEYLKGHLGAKYDWMGLIYHFVFWWVKRQDDRKWWCSELCGYVLDKFNIHPFPDFRISPNKMARIFNLERQPREIMITKSGKF